jgi:hypothetical protein
MELTVQVDGLPPLMSTMQAVVAVTAMLSMVLTVPMAFATQALKLPFTLLIAQLYA